MAAAGKDESPKRHAQRHAVPPGSAQILLKSAKLELAQAPPLSDLGPRALCILTSNNPSLSLSDCPSLFPAPVLTTRLSPRAHQVVIPVVPRPWRSGLHSLEHSHEGSPLLSEQLKGEESEGKPVFPREKTEAPRRARAESKRRSPHEESPMRGGPTAGQLESRPGERRSGRSRRLTQNRPLRTYLWGVTPQYGNREIPAHPKGSPGRDSSCPETLEVGPPTHWSTLFSSDRGDILMGNGLNWKQPRDMV